MEGKPENFTQAGNAQKNPFPPSLPIVLGIILGVIAGYGTGYLLLISGVGFLLGVVVEFLNTRLPKKTALSFVLLVVPILLVMRYFLGGPELGPAPSFTGRVISVTPATGQIQGSYGDTILGTIVLQEDNGNQLQLVVKHASGDGCQGASELHLSDIHVGAMVTGRYWPDKPDSGANPHTGHAVYIGDRC
ncbi:MAG TPA: hypothetical protein VKR06_05475 [Ktedonosporobacter sp.]|nr:hypothetical protein [Ktedonosporobacter sp.]